MILTSECMTTLRVCADAMAGSRAIVAAAAAWAAHFTIRMCSLLVLFDPQLYRCHCAVYATGVPFGGEQRRPGSIRNVRAMSTDCGSQRAGVRRSGHAGAAYRLAGVSASHSDSTVEAMAIACS